MWLLPNWPIRLCSNTGWASITYKVSTMNLKFKKVFHFLAKLMFWNWKRSEFLLWVLFPVSWNWILWKGVCREACLPQGTPKPFLFAPEHSDPLKLKHSKNELDCLRVHNNLLTFWYGFPLETVPSLCFKTFFLL